jgi:hypothetical protein
MDSNEILTQALKVLIPSSYLEHFECVSIKDDGSYWEVVLEEKTYLIP